ncbi:MAG: RNA polymerase sigma factor [bacterium]
MKEDTSPSDEELIRRFQEGEESAFEELVARFRDPIYNFVLRLLWDPSLAEDILQETFLRLWSHRNSYKEIARFSTWIYTIAGNLAKSELRRRKIRRWFSLGIGGGGGGGAASDEHSKWEIPDESMDIQRDLERRNINKRVEEEILKLPLEFREVVILRDLQELSYEEISKILKIPLGTVKSRVNRGRSRLRKKLKDLL